MDDAAYRLLNFLLEKQNENENPEITSNGGNQSDATLLDWIRSCYGLKHVAYITTDHVSRRTREPVYAGTYCPEWQEYYRNSEAERFDPAIRRGLVEIMPFEWGVIRNPDSDQKKFMGRVHDFRLGNSGFSIPIRDRHGARALVTMTTEFRGRNWRKFSHEYRSELVNLSYYLHERLSPRSKLGQQDCLNAPRLTPRETEVLQWTAQGKTANEIGKIFGISRRVVDFHIDNSKRKLNTATKPHATAKATSLGLILPTH